VTNGDQDRLHHVTCPNNRRSHKRSLEARHRFPTLLHHHHHHHHHASLSLPLLICLVDPCARHSPSTAALCKCKKATKDVGPCSTSLDVCGCLKSIIHWRYKCTASASGVSAGYEWTKSGEGAAKGAIVALFNKLGSAGQCNCQSAPFPLGKCQINARACFSFASESNLDKGVASFKAFVTGPSGVSTASVEVTGKADANDAVQTAVQQLLAKDPSIVAKCQSANMFMDEPFLFNKFDSLNMTLPAIDNSMDKFLISASELFSSEEN